MTTHNNPAEPAALQSGAPSRPLPQHAVRAALLDLIAEWGSITSNQAAQMIRQSSGTCSFHLRQLARYGLIEEAPTGDGRSRPWRLRWEGSLMPPEPGAPAAGRPGDDPMSDLTPELATDLEDGSYRHWLANRSAAPAEWQRDQTSSDVLHLTSDELADLGAAVRALLAPYRGREPRAGTHPVAAVARLFPLLADTGGDTKAR
ncbi:winged helix-turn-helix domain-containing protein [Kitasatospora sp. NPDC094019]|uniref:winged helix-turn-helix domain-containing protein n=1 Tax=Kitasatospora sp. NPDC094019 TaxID=3364091 RepID=UPI00382D561F